MTINVTAQGDLGRLASLKRDRRFEVRCTEMDFFGESDMIFTTTFKTHQRPRLWQTSIVASCTRVFRIDEKGNDIE